MISSNGAATSFDATTEGGGCKPPVPLNGDLANLPPALDPLKALPNWVVWKFELRGEKWTKPPFDPKRPSRYAKNNDPSTWGTYAQALAAYQAGGFDGIGFNLFNTFFNVFDLDKCRNPATGDIAEVADDIVDRAASYTELTPSGTGLRVIGLGNGGAKLHRKQKIAGSVVEVESYRGAERYITVTGNPLEGTLEVWPHMVNIGDVVDAVVTELDGARPGLNSDAPTGERDNGVSTLDDWIRVRGRRFAHDDDFKDVDGSKLPPKLLRLLKTVPKEGTASEAFHHAVCWLHYDLKWSARKIGIYIESAAVVPPRYENRLDQEIHRCLFNADQKKAHARATKEAQANKPKPEAPADNTAFLAAVSEKFSDYYGDNHPLQYLVENDQAPNALAAALMLCKGASIDPKTLGYIPATAGTSAKEADEAWNPWLETPAPRLDHSLLPRVVREAAATSARVSGADIDAFAIGYLVGLAACGDTRLRVTPKQHAVDWSVPLLLWVLLVAPPSSMKSEVIKSARALAASLDMAERERYAREMTMAEVGTTLNAFLISPQTGAAKGEQPAAPKRSKAEMKADAKAAREQAIEKIKPPRQHVCGDITIERYVDLLGANPGGVSMFRDELSGWLGSLGRYSSNGKDGADRAFYCALRDGSAHDRQRMSSPDVHLPHCAGSFFGAVQPDRLLDMELPVSDGLLQRFMPLMMREAGPYEDEGSDDAKKLLKPVRDALAALVPVMQRDPYGQMAAVPYKLEPEGAQLYQTFANDMRLAGRAQEPSREFGECLQKMGPMWLAIALLFHLIETGTGSVPSTSVPYEAARRADAIIRGYFIPHAEQFYDLLSGGSSRLRGVASAILRCEEDEIVLRDVVRRCHAMQKMERSEHIKLMQRFEGFGWLTRTDEKGSTIPRWERTAGLGARFEEELKREVEARAQLTAVIKKEGAARKAAETEPPS